MKLGLCRGASVAGSRATMALQRGEISETSQYCAEYVGSLGYRQICRAPPKVPRLGLREREELHFGKTGAPQSCLKLLGLEVAHP